ncbi:hypothetical protein HDU77_005408 [Chytriomyces hyalinus]|nr:hypothetical protein HDU77_005408 [Chytriomyces hyalinus]
MTIASTRTDSEFAATFSTVQIACEGSVTPNITVQSSSHPDHKSALVSLEHVSGDFSRFSKSEFKATSDGETLSISFKTPTTSVLDFFKLSSEARLSVSLPVDVKSLFIINRTGRVTLDGPNVSDCLDVKSSLGSFIAKSAVVANSISIETGTGSISFEGPVSSSSFIDLSTQTGRITLAAPVSSNFVSLKTNTGRIDTQEHIFAQQDIQMETNTGSVTAVKSLTSASIGVVTGTGSISIHHATTSKFLAETNTGRVEADRVDGYHSLLAKSGTGAVRLGLVPGVTNAKHSITSNTGSITLNLIGWSGFFFGRNSTGSIKCSGVGCSSSSKLKSPVEMWIGTGSRPEKHDASILECETNTGSISLTVLPKEQ